MLQQTRTGQVASCSKRCHTAQAPGLVARRATRSSSRTSQLAAAAATVRAGLLWAGSAAVSVGGVLWYSFGSTAGSLVQSWSVPCLGRARGGGARPVQGGSLCLQLCSSCVRALCQQCCLLLQSSPSISKLCSSRQHCFDREWIGRAARPLPLFPAHAHAGAHSDTMCSHLHTPNLHSPFSSSRQSSSCHLTAARTCVCCRRLLPTQQLLRSVLLR